MGRGVACHTVSHVPITSSNTPRKALDRVGKFGDHQFVVGRVHDTAANVVFEDQQADSPRSGNDRRDLRQNIDTVLILFNHALDTPNLTLHPP